MKLDQRKIHWIIQQKQKGLATKQIAHDMKISRRRVQQILKSYAEGKQEPAIGENMGRPRKPFDEKEAQVVGEAYTLYRFMARMLEVAVRKVFKIRISHNRIHMYLKAAEATQVGSSMACPQDISIGMNQVGQISRFALLSMTHPG
jgi:putative transposase